MIKELLIAFAVCCGSVCTAETDPFVGKFISESKGNFGTNEPGEFVVNISKDGQKYQVVVSHKNEKRNIRVDVFGCNPDLEDFVSRHPGSAMALCHRDGDFFHPFFLFTENGGKTASGGVYETKYFGRIQWMILGFKKVE